MAVPHRQRGAALLTVVWFLALMTALAASALLGARSYAELGRARLSAVEATTAADSGIRRALVALADQDPRRHWPIDGTEQRFEFHAQSIVVTIRDEAERADLNTADRSTLEAVLQQAAIKGVDTQGLLDRILERRPYERVDELRSVGGVSAELFEQLSRQLTVYTRQPQRVSTSGESGPLSGRVFRIRAHLETDRQMNMAREAVVRLTGNARHPFLIYVWETVRQQP